MSEVPGVASGWDPHVAEFATDETVQTWVIRAAMGANYQIVWGDGLMDSQVGTGIDQTLIHNYAGPGTYDVQMQFADPDQLMKIDVTSDGLMGPMPDYSIYPSLMIVVCSDNLMTGHIPDLSLNASLMVFDCGQNTLDGPMPSLVDNAALTNFICYDNLMTGSIPPLTANTLLKEFNCSENQLTGVIPSLSGNTDLTDFVCDDNMLTGYTSSTMAATCIKFDASTNLLTEAAVDQILADFATNVAARPAVGQILLGGVGNAPPSVAGLMNRTAIMVAKPGWTVTVNSLVPVVRPDMSTSKLWYKLNEAADPLVNSGDGGARPLTYSVGTLAPSYAVAGGTFGACLVLPDGVADKCGEQNATDDSAWFGHGCSVWAWINPVASAATPQFVFGNTPDAFVLKINTDRSASVEVHYTTGAVVTTSTAAAQFGWGDLVFLCATNDGAVTRLYVNGVEQASLIDMFHVQSFAAYAWTLGTWDMAPIFANMTGMVLDCGFDDSVFTPVQILALYNSVVP
jgi:hypothetical protein